MKTLSTNNYKQSGAALPVALVMLLISTIVGLASIRSTTIQTKMSANMYDRSLAYQGAEAALREAEEKIINSNNYTDISVDCTDTVSAETCPSIPKGTFSGIGASDEWKTINEGSTPNTTLVSSNSSPQYYIERIGLTGGIDELARGRSANDDTYESWGESTANSMLFRITARSSDPAIVKDRSIVVLQTTIKKNI